MAYVVRGNISPKTEHLGHSTDDHGGVLEWRSRSVCQFASQPLCLALIQVLDPPFGRAICDQRCDGRGSRASLARVRLLRFKDACGPTDDLLRWKVPQ